MATRLQPLFPPAIIPPVATVLYTAENTTRIDKVTVANISTGLANVSLFIVPPGDSPSPVNMVQPPRPISPGQAWDASSAVRHTLAVGDSLAAGSDTVGALNIAASGSVITQ